MTTRAPAARAPACPGETRARPRALLARSALPVCDAGALVVAIAVAGGLSWPAIAYAAAVFGTLRLTGAQRLRISPRWSDELPWLAFAVAVPSVPFRSWVLVAAAGTGLAVGRLACATGVRAARRHRLLAEPTVIAGTGTLGREIAQILRDHPEYGLTPVGFVDRLPPGPGSALPLLGAPEDLAEVVERFGVRHVLVCFPAATDAELASILRASRTRVSVVPRLYELGTTIPARYRDEIHAIPLAALSPAPVGKLAKRVFDLVVGGVLLIAVAPLLAVLMTALLIRHGRPVLFRQVRLSRDGLPVTIVKLRTLDDPCPDTSWAVREEACGRLRRFLRASHFDELPQLWCVLRGSLSLVGPRPERPYFAARFARTIPGYPQRHRVPAGVTGWAQVHGLHGDTSISQRVRFDNAYIENRSCRTDLVILARTLGTPLAGLRRSRRSEGERP